MRLTRIITAKIEPEIFRKIVDGSKRFEVRDESFQDAEFIRYVGPDGKRLPGLDCMDGALFRLGKENFFNSGDRVFVRLLSDVDKETFDRLFPESTKHFYVAPIGERLTFNDIFNGGEEQWQEKRRSRSSGI